MIALVQERSEEKSLEEVLPLFPKRIGDQISDVHNQAAMQGFEVRFVDPAKFQELAVEHEIQPYVNIEEGEIYACHLDLIIGTNGYRKKTRFIPNRPMKRPLTC